jgi:hypothetical protein
MWQGREEERLREGEKERIQSARDFNRRGKMTE